MHEVYWAHNQMERRAFRLNNSTLTNLPASSWSPGTLESNQPLKRVHTRASLIRLLDERITLSVERNHPLCLVVAEFQTEAEQSELPGDLYSVARMSNIMLRPTDIVVRYGERSLAFILHEADQRGGLCAVRRVTEQLSRQPNAILTNPHFGFASNLAGESEPAETMLLKAEISLSDGRRARAKDFWRSRSRRSFGARVMEGKSRGSDV